MPFFGILLIIIGLWILFNVFNGNLIDLVIGKAGFNFNTKGLESSTPSNPKVPYTVEQLAELARSSGKS